MYEVIGDDLRVGNKKNIYSLNFEGSKNVPVLSLRYNICYFNKRHEAPV